jgi:hypothetical protein
MKQRPLHLVTSGAALAAGCHRDQKLPPSARDNGGQMRALWGPRVAKGLVAVEPCGQRGEVMAQLLE